MPTPSTRLNSLSRILLVFVNLGLGLLPSFAFFAWVERNASLPWVGIDLGWPWLPGQSWSLAAMAAWNCALFLLFGLLHSFFAQSRIQKSLSTWIPPQAIRTFYLAVTGLSLVALMGLWQNTGIVLWSLPLSLMFVNGLSFTLFWGFLLAAGWTLRRFDPLEFIGLKQLYSSTAELARTEGSPQLNTTGIYGRVRHPLYSFTSLAFILTPFMTLDRAILTGSMALYLIFAIPVEERKLIALFGRAYEDYKLRVPAVIPRWSR